jgi:hypothetical protein
MFRSRVRDVVYSQAEHQRLAGAIAAAWATHPLEPFESFVLGVATHDRGYGELDEDAIGSIAPERWIEIQAPAVEPQADPVADLVVAMHVQRLADNFTPLDAHVPERLADAGVDPELAAAADKVTELCDRLAFDFCFEAPSSGRVGDIDYTLDADGSATLDPWPLAVDELTETVVGYRADSYPRRLEPVERTFRLRRPRQLG